MPSEHDVRQRAAICQDCWFWKEMSCALASPVDGTCANKRPVQGRRATAVPAQASLVPLAAGHGLDVAARSRQQVAASAPTPFSADAPEATFTMARLRADEAARGHGHETVPMPVPELPVRSAPPSFREIRSGRAAAASRAPVAEVRIPLEELEGGTLLAQASSTPHEPATTLSGIDQLVERVRQRTAARLSRTGAFHPA